MMKYLSSFITMTALVLLVGVSPAHAAVTVGTVSASSVAVDVETTLSATYDGDTAVESCTLYVDEQNSGNMTLSGTNSGTASADYTFTDTGTHEVYVQCADVNGTLYTGAEATITVQSQGSLAPPTVGPVTPDEIMVDAETTFGASFSNSFDIEECRLFLNGEDQGAMTLSGHTDGEATMMLTLTTSGSHTMHVQCTDVANNRADGPLTDVQAVALTDDGSAAVALQPPFDISVMINDAELVVRNTTRASLSADTGKACEWSATEATARVEAVFSDIANITARTMIENFVACGTESTFWLGAGERLGIVNSYRAAFGRMPSTEAHWSDVIKIGNGRFTTETSATAEAEAKTTFRQIYLREANMNVESDRNAVMVMAYGLRPLPRNLQAEAQAIATFRAVFGHGPTSAEHWDAVRATAYSGATR